MSSDGATVLSDGVAVFADGATVLSVGATVGWLSQGGVGFVVPAVLGATLVGTALFLATRALHPPRSPFVAAGCLLGTLGVLAQLGLAASAPASRAAFLLGAVGALCWYGATLGLLADRVTGLGRQWLAVGSLLWVGGTITVTASAAPERWPLTWSLVLGLGVLVVAILLWLSRTTSTGTGWQRWGLAVLSGVFVLPAVLGLLAGEEILFVAYLVVFVVSVLGWSLFRLAL